MKFLRGNCEASLTIMQHDLDCNACVEIAYKWNFVAPKQTLFYAIYSTEVTDH